MIKLSLSRFRRIFRAAIILLFASLSVIVTGCVYDPIYYGPPAHSRYYPDYYDYYFYPSARVYFHFTTGFYFYWVDGRWVRTRTLPPHINLGLFDRVKLKIEADKPYTRFDEHIRLYKPRPEVRIDKEKSLKEREANKIWFQEFEKRKDKPVKKPTKDKKDRKDKRLPGMR